MDEPAHQVERGDRGKLGVPTGVGMVVANMIGAGVFLSAGFMAQDLDAGQILLAWAVGTVLALAGARAYAAVAVLVPRSGGEYRYLSDLMHPLLGYLAGWTSLLVGFSAPIAIDAVAAAAFARTLWPALPLEITAAGVVAGLTALHAAGLRVSVRAQNALVVLKGLLVVGFLVIGLVAGSHAWPVWEPANTHAGFPLAAFMASLFYVAFAYSGWNAAAYAAGEFREPARNVPRAMLIGCALVGVFYLLVNWVFVANLTPQTARAVFDYETARITLGHLVAEDLVGEAGAGFVSALLVVAFLSAASAMTLLGPRVYAAMAEDGYLPRVLAGRKGRPPTGAVILQGAIALVLVFWYSLQQVLQNMGAILTLFAALVCISLIKVRLSGRHPDAHPPATSLVAAVLYVLGAAWMLWFGFRDSPSLLVWLALVAVAATGAWLFTRRRKRV